MARIVYRHPRLSKFDYHILTDLDFWDARKILGDLVTVKRNFGEWPPGDEFPTQVVAEGVSRKVIKEVERRLTKAIISPPRHVIVRSIMMQGFFEFDPALYYPERWSQSLVLHFTYKRLPLEQGLLNSLYQTIELMVVDGRVRVTRVQRTEKCDPVIRTAQDARRRAQVPSCF
jgi:hypothetical protein